MTFGSPLGRLAATLALVGVLGAAAAAQPQQQVSAANIIHWPDFPWPLEHFSRIVTGDMSGNKIPDGVVLAEKTPYFLYDPHVHDAVVKMPATANDIDMFPGDKPGDRSELAAVTVDGLWLHGIVEQEPPPVGLGAVFAPRHIKGAEWTNAKQVRVALMNDDEAPDFVGLASDGVTIIQLWANDQGGYDTIAPFTAVAPVVQVEPVNWDDDEVMDVAVITADGVQVHAANDDGFQMYDIRNLLSGDVFSVVRSQTHTDMLAWVTSRPNTDQMLFVLDPLGYTGPIVLSTLAPTLPFLEAVSVSAGDHDGDGDGDVLLYHRASHEGFVIENQINTALEDDPIFEAEIQAIVPAGPEETPAPDNSAWTVVKDLDRDGFADALLPVQSLPGLVYQRGPFHYFASAVNPIVGVRSCCDGGEGEITFTLQLPNNPAATHVQTILWRQPDAGELLENESAAHVLWDLDDLVPVTLPDDSQALEMVLDIPESMCEFDPILYMEMRLVEVAQNTVRRVVSRTWTGAFSASEDNLADEFGFTEDDPFAYILGRCPGSPPGPNNAPAAGQTEIGGFVPLVDLPAVDGLPTLGPPDFGFH